MTDRTLELADEGYHPRFRPRRFRALVKAHGRDVVVERQAACSCRKVSGLHGSEGGELAVDDAPGGEVGGEHHGLCPDCGGTGSVYLSAKPTRALCSDNVRRGFRDQHGTGVEGDCSFTFLPEAAPGYLDRIAMRDAFDKVSEVCVRKGLVDRFRYPIASHDVVVGAAGNAASPEVVERAVVYLRRVDGSGLPSGEPLEVGVDGDVTPDGAWDWTLGDANGTAPAVGEGYAITFWAQARYVVTEGGKAHRPQTTEYPNQIDRAEPAATPMLVRVKAKVEVVGPPPGSAA